MKILIAIENDEGQVVLDSTTFSVDGAIDTLSAWERSQANKKEVDIDF